MTFSRADGTADTFAMFRKFYRNMPYFESKYYLDSTGARIISIRVVTAHSSPGVPPPLIQKLLVSVRLNVGNYRISTSPG